MRISKKTALYTVFISLAIMLLITVKLPYYIYKPGSADELSFMVEVENRHESKGEMHLVTVSGGQATPIEYVYARLSSFKEITPIEQVLPKGFTDEDYRKYQMKMMENSQDASKVVAYTAANKQVQIDSNGVYVVQVVEGMPAAKSIKIGDRILSVDGTKIKQASDLVQYVQSKKADDLIELTIERAGQEILEQIKVQTFPNDKNKVGVGIQLVADQKVNVTPPIQFKSGNIGGPSAGLMFALEIYDQLTKDDLTKGYQIAGTGEVDMDGNVFRIGGVDKKVVAAHRKGIDIFFVPNEKGAANSNYIVAKETAELIKTDMEIVPVDSFEEALTYLSKLQPK